MRYAELHCKSNFSFLQGASHPEELVERAALAGYCALAVTDVNSLAGVVRAHVAVKEVPAASAVGSGSQTEGADGGDRCRTSSGGILPPMETASSGGILPPMETATGCRRYVGKTGSGLKLIVGAEITPIDAPPVLLWATDRAAYGRLSRLITLGRRRAAKGDCRLTFDDLAAAAEGLLAGVVVDWSEIQRSGLPGPAPGQDAPATLLARYREVFGDRGYLMAEWNRGADDDYRLDVLLRLSRESGLPLVAAGDVYYHSPARQPLQHVLTAIRHGVTVEQAGGLLFSNAQHHLKPLDEIAEIYARIPEAIERTVEIADRCTFSLDELRYEYPLELVPAGAGPRPAASAVNEVPAASAVGSRPAASAVNEVPAASAVGSRPAAGDVNEVPAASAVGSGPDASAYGSGDMSPMEYLHQLTWQGAARRYPQGVPDKVRGLIEHELQLIEELHYEAYFLTVWDLVRFARSRDILCQGRGSAANSAVCYCLEITAVDPNRVDLLFERFISRERDEAPDIDVDFEHERREEVLQYLYQKYGRERAGLAAAVITYRTRSAVREVGKALGLSLDRIDRLTKNLDGYPTQGTDLEHRCREMGVDTESEVGRRLIHLANELIGFPRHLSQHVGGMVMTRGPLCELVPIENAAMPDRTVVQWDKDDLEALGILKVDCLSLGMLTAIRKCFQMVQQTSGRSLTLANIPPGDSRVYDMICDADTIGVFQIESRAQMSMLPRLRPRCYYDLVIEVAIVRPGPIQGQMVHPYLRRRAGLEPVTYPNDEIRQVLDKTMGVPIFQEQVMRLAVVAAGFTPGEADQLRRAMGAWRRSGKLDQFRQKLLDGMRERGLTEEFAERVFQQIRGFGEYGFPESHAASFALLVYVSAYLKRYYPAAFCASILNSQPMGFYAPSQLIRDARQHGVEVRPVDVNHSDWDCTLEGEQEESILRLGFRMIKGISQPDMQAIVQARQAGPFASVDELARRTGLLQAVIARLAEADAFGSLGSGRRQALWDSLSQRRNRHPEPLFDDRDPPVEPDADLPAATVQEDVVADYQTVGLTLRPHPVSFLREQLKEIRARTAAELQALPHNRQVVVAGLIILRQRPSTGKGITFVTLEDETGVVNLVLHKHIWERFHKIARHSNAWIVRGRLESKQSVIHVVVQHIQDLHEQLTHLASSRDFQ